ncbi:hypothetical protein WJT74_02280 [Sphingomicrobium sp. XHP0239]|uniref:hypothetical protein n=1 Tax=Sphingomicrobium maritimum TaxID=3133972 RepID=UPI0031CC8F41
MDFFKLIKSLDDLVFEILSWLYFYPRTLLRVLFRPFALMSDTARQMDEDDEPAFGDRIGPPLFLAITLALGHFIMLGVDPSAETAQFEGGVLEGFMADDRNLLAYQIVYFGLLPLFATVRQLGLQHIVVSKSTMKAPFYAHCYAAAGFAALTTAAQVGAHEAGEERAALFLAFILGGSLIAILWIGLVEARWFHRTLDISRWKAFGHALLVLGGWAALSIGLDLLLT